VRPVIDLLRESAELDPRLTEACGDGCDPVNDPDACLASQIAWALAHPEPAHEHAWQPGPVIAWSHTGYSGQPGDMPQYQHAEMAIQVCACGVVRPIILRDMTAGPADWPELVTA